MTCPKHGLDHVSMCRAKKGRYYVDPEAQALKRGPYVDLQMRTPAIVAGMVGHILIGPTDDHETLRWPHRRKFLKEVTENSLQPQMDNRQCARQFTSARRSA